MNIPIQNENADLAHESFDNSFQIELIAATRSPAVSSAKKGQKWTQNTNPEGSKLIRNVI